MDQEALVAQGDAWHAGIGEGRATTVVTRSRILAVREDLCVRCVQNVVLWPHKYFALGLPHCPGVQRFLPRPAFPSPERF